MSARRFMWRWAVRTVRIEWRQHIGVLALLVAGVTIAVTLGLTGYNLGSPTEKYLANAKVIVYGDDPDGIEEVLIAGGHSFGTTQNMQVDRAGSVQPVTLLAMDPANRITAPHLALLDGRYPAADDEIALTDRAVTDPPAIGSSIELDGVSVTVVGTVENPMHLSSEFALAPNLAHFPSADQNQIGTRFWVDAEPSAINVRGLSESTTFEESSDDSREALTVLTSVIGAFGMLEVALLVGSAFAVIAKRRERQYGLMAAAGATPRLIRSASLMSGLILGIVGATTGLAFGVIAARVVSVALETTMGHRIVFALPLATLLPHLILAVAVAAWAARRPSVKLSKQSVISVLSSTRPRPEPVGRSTILGAVIAAIGVSMFLAGFTQDNAMLGIAGVVLSPIGVLLMSPLLVKLIGVAAARLPLEARLAGRAISRYNRRFAAVVAAIALALAIPMGIAVVTESIDARSSKTDPNLADTTLVIWHPAVTGEGKTFAPLVTDDGPLTGAMQAAQSAAPNLRFTPINVAFDEDTIDGARFEGSEDGVVNAGPVLAMSPSLGTCYFCNQETTGSDDEVFDVERAWIVTPDMLDALNLESEWVTSSAAALTRTDDNLIGTYDDVLDDERTKVATNWTNAAAVPPVLLSPQFVEQAGYEMMTIGWLGWSDDAITSDERAAIRDMVSTNDADIEFHRPQSNQSRLRNIGLLIGLVVGVGITVSAVGLLAAEQARDVALLASIGAQPSSGRRMAAAIAALLALAGATIGSVIGYLPLLPMIDSEVDNFPFVVPFQFLLGLLIVFPLIAAAVGLLMNRRAAQGTSLRAII